MSRCFLLIAAAACPFGMQAIAQQPPTPVWQVMRIEEHPDHSVTFRFPAPATADVKVSIAGKDQAMTRDANGFWTATVGPLDPGIHEYAFVLSGVRVSRGEVEIRGPHPALHDRQPVPRGTVAIDYYQSQGRERRLRVYLPPDYDRSQSRRYPVLYLYGGGDEAQWTETGRAQIILDNLIAQRRAVPMIVVMPDSAIGDLPATVAQTVAVVERELADDVEPMLASRYRLMTGREQRAIAGLSFGGGIAFGVGMRHLDRFAYVGEFATKTFGGPLTPGFDPDTYQLPYDAEAIAPGIYRNLLAPATRPRLFYMSAGESDPRLPYHVQAYEDFRHRAITPVFRTFPGAHEFRFFRAAFADFAARLFVPPRP